MNSNIDSDEGFACKGCDCAGISDDDIYQCVGCDSCHQSRGRYLTEKESEDFYDEDDPEWYCATCSKV